MLVCKTVDVSFTKKHWRGFSTKLLDLGSAWKGFAVWWCSAPTVTDCGAGSHNYMFIATPETHGIRPTKPQTHFWVLHPPVRAHCDLRVSHTGLHVWKQAMPGLCRLEEKQGSAVGYGSSELLCLFARGRGCQGGQARGRGVGTPWFSLPYSLFCFLLWSRGGDRLTDWCSLLGHP